MAVWRETLRLFPAIPFLIRVATQDTELPRHVGEPMKSKPDWLTFFHLYQDLDSSTNKWLPGSVAIHNGEFVTIDIAALQRSREHARIRGPWMRCSRIGCSSLLGCRCHNLPS